MGNQCHTIYDITACIKVEVMVVSDNSRDFTPKGESDVAHYHNTKELVLIAALSDGNACLFPACENNELFLPSRAGQPDTELGGNHSIALHVR